MSRRTLASLLFLAAAGCGYHTSGHADLVPKNIRTICIPAFGNNTTRYRLTDLLPEALAREIISRTRYRIVADPKDADAVLRGSVLNVFSSPTVYDPNTARASSIQMTAQIQFTLVDRTTGKTIFERPSLDLRERYEISALRQETREQQLDRNVYFDESGIAMERLSRSAAKSIVSAILENF